MRSAMATKRIFPVNTTVLFATFSKWQHGRRTPISASIEPLRDFMVPRVRKFVIIDQLYPGSDAVMPRIEVYGKGNKTCNVYKSSWCVYLLKPFLERCNINGTHILFKMRDFLSVIDWSFRDGTTFDYFIGMESMNTLAGILLRRFGRVKKVIYYVFDYSPERFQNSWFNAVYLALDRFCAIHADYIWDVSKAMQTARISAGLDPKRSAPVIHVPIGLYPDQIQAYPVSKIKKHALVYMGTFGHENGPDIAIRAFALVRKKIPDAVLHMIGGSDEDIVELKKLAERLHAGDSVIFHGMIPDNVEMSKVIRSCAIGLAPYRNIAGSPRLYADSSKIRAYFASGLPVATSSVPPLGREAAEKGAAVIAHDDPKSFALSILSIFQNKNLYEKLRKNAIQLGKYNTWENSFVHAFKEMSMI